MPRLTEEQLAARKRGIGSSDVAAIVGVSPYEDSTPMSVFVDKTGLRERTDDGDDTSDEMEMGHLVEPALVEFFKWKTGRMVVTMAAAVNTGPEPWMLASCDTKVLHENAHVECKNVGVGITSRGWDLSLDDGYPDHVRVQMAWQCEVIRTERCYLVALVLGRPRIYVYEHDRELGRLLTEQCRAFWLDVEAGRAPPLDASPATLDYLKATYPKPHERTLHASPEAESLARERHALDQTRAAADKRRAVVDANMRAIIGDADRIEGAGWYATWKARKDEVRVLRWNFGKEFG